MDSGIGEGRRCVPGFLIQLAASSDLGNGVGRLCSAPGLV
jgi:hypothetical protein